ncbi:MAG: hypothetical protein ACYS6W_08685 [Planctomycetota bacterium]|jgi:hypothetical protein
MSESKTNEELEAEAKKAEESKKWDEHKQKLDQAESVASKAKLEAEEYAEALAEKEAQLAEMKVKLEANQQTVQTKKDQLAEMDSQYVDKSVISNIQRLEESNKKQAERIAKQEEKITKAEAAEQQRQDELAVERMKQEILKDCDKEFGSKYRNDAYKLADNLVDTGKEKQPKTQYAGYKLMRKCYKQVKDEAEAKEKAEKEKEKVPTDSGSGGISFTKTKRKSGSMQEVLADMKKDTSWLND